MGWEAGESSRDIFRCGACDAFGNHAGIRDFLVGFHFDPKLLPPSLITDSVQENSEEPSPGVSLVFEGWNGFQRLSCGVVDQVFSEIGASRKALGCAVQSVQVLEKYPLTQFGTMLLSSRLKRQNLQCRPLLHLVITFCDAGFISKA